MKYRELGNTGLIVSEIGFGAWGIGGGVGGHQAYGPTVDSESLIALHAAKDAGVTFFDTSDLYGMGHSEELIGRAFRKIRDQVVIATKGGMVNPTGDLDFSPSYMRKALEKSLSRLVCDHVDIYQLHSVPIEVLEQDHGLLRFLEDIVLEGKTRVVGVSARSPREALVAVERFGFRAVQVNLNLLDWRAIDCGLLECCTRSGAAVIARTPLCFGFLTGRYTAEDVTNRDDHRGRWSREQIEQWTAAAKIFDETIRPEPDQTLGQKALRFCLSFSGVASVIPGALTELQVTENSRASDFGPLSAQELANVERVYRAMNFDEKRVG